MNENIAKLIIAGTLAAIPAAFWGYIFYKKQPESKRMTLKVFIAGAISVAPLLLYKYLWQFFPWINAFLYTNNFKDDSIGFSNVMMIPVDVILTFMLVGIIEEVAKFFAVKSQAEQEFSSITDSIEFFIIASLGFSFTENIIYFYNIIAARGTEGIMLPFIFRSLFSTFAHVMFSGMFGYYYGLAYFASPVLKEKHNQKKWTFIRSLSKKLGFREESLFYREKVFQGLVTASVLHAFFNIFLEMNWTFLIVPFLTFGFITLSSLFEDKEVDKEYVLETVESD